MDMGMFREEHEGALTEFAREFPATTLATHYEKAAEELRLLDVLERCPHDPKWLIGEIRGFDPTQQEYFGFDMFEPDSPAVAEGLAIPDQPGDGHVWDAEDGEWVFDPSTSGWHWQSSLVDWWQDEQVRKHLILKARQLGITWLAVALGLWYMLFKPGSTILCYSYTEDEAIKLIQRAWLMFQSIPGMLRGHVEIIKPNRSNYPTEWIVLRHADGRLSTMQALPATKKHGHGETATLIIMDEVARQDYARDIYTAVNPAASRGGRLIMISTASGVSNLETGEGNFFHRLFATRKEKGLGYRFLPWYLHPERGGPGAPVSPQRDPEWYAREAMALDEVERNQQYPHNENDAFMLSGLVYFNRESLSFYRESVVRAKMVGQFVLRRGRQARWVPIKDGMIEVWELPREGRKYAFGVDTASGKGTDYTSAHVIDLSSGSVVAEFHGKLEAPAAAVQLHVLGKWYNDARIAIEKQGGHGDSLIFALRDGTRSIPVYRNLYRHVRYDNASKPISEDFGFPMGEKGRALVLDTLKNFMRERSFPWLSASTVDELGTFVYADTKPSPRAQEGCNDDRVMSLAIASLMFVMFGQAPRREDRKRRRRGATKQTYTPSPAKAGGRA